MGLTPMDYLLWIYNGGGLDIYQEAYGKFGMNYLVTGVTPYTLNMKKVELAVRNVIHGRPIKNTDALKNPEALDYYRDLKALSV